MKIFDSLSCALTLCLLCLSKLSADATSEIPPSIYDVSAKTIDGREITFGAFRGKVLLIVNVASDDRQASQLADLQKLNEKIGNQGILILAFPSSDFTPTEPTNLQELQALYYDKYHLTFPVFENVHVTGPNKHPLYIFLTSSKTDPDFGRDILWNYEKFVIDKEGHVVGRFSTTTKPDDPHLIKTIENAFKG